MKKIYLCSFTFVFLLLFYSCSKQTTNNPLDDFPGDMSSDLSPMKVIDLEIYDVLKPEIVYKLTDGYIIKSQIEQQMISRVYSSSNKVIHGVDKGNAPEELVSPSSFIQKGNETFIYDIAKKSIYKVDISFPDSTMKLSEYKRLQVKERPFIINLLSDGFVASGMFEKAWIAYFNDKDQIESVLPFPSFEQIKKFVDVEKSSLFLSTLTAIKSDEKKMVCATQKCGVLSFSDIKDGQIIEYNQLKYFGPKVGAPRKEGATTIAFDRDNKIGFCGIACDDNYVFALYSGRTFNSHGASSHHCEHILIYDWNGNPIKHLILENPLYTLSYDSENKIIYGIGYAPEGVILEYKLSGLVY